MVCNAIWDAVLTSPVFRLITYKQYRDLNIKLFMLVSQFNMVYLTGYCLNKSKFAYGGAQVD